MRPRFGEHGTWMSSLCFQGVSRGTPFIRGPNVPMVSLKRRSRNSLHGGLPLLDLAHDNGQVFAYELHPGSDIYDGATYEMFLDYTNDHPAACLNYDPSHFLLQQLDYIDFIRLYGERIKGFHVKDAEFRPTGRVGVYGGYQSWAGRAARFRSLGDGQVDFTQVFTLLTEAGYDSWAVLEWECCVKSPEQGAAEGAPFIAKHIIETTDVAFDDFAGGETDTWNGIGTFLD